jgi:hypothetical protein
VWFERTAQVGSALSADRVRPETRQRLYRFSIHLATAAIGCSSRKTVPGGGICDGGRRDLMQTFPTETAKNPEKFLK